MNSLHALLVLSALLFTGGIAIVITKRNGIMVLIGIELMLNASILNVLVFNKMFNTNMDGQLFALFIMVVAVAESAVGLAIIINVYKYYNSAIPDEISELKE